MVDPGYTTNLNINQAVLWHNKKPQLSHLDIELTERCNNACIHCYINLSAQDHTAAMRELSADQWKDIIQQAANMGVLSIRFTGGEPLLRNDFIDIYLFTRRLGIQVILFTNARLITTQLADLFAKVPPRKKIEISSYGMYSSSYDSIARSSGAFVEFRHGVDLLLERGIPFVVKSVLLPPNKGEKDEFETWAASIPWMDRRPSYAAILELRTRRDSEVKNRMIRSLRLSPEECVMFVTSDSETSRREMAQFGSRFMGPQGAGLFTCSAGETGCIDAYGICQMCMPLRHPDTVYDLKQGNLYQVFTEVFPRNKEIRATNTEYLQRCALCFLKGLCEQCPGKSWEEHGTLDTPVEYLCQVAHAQAHYLGLLDENENSWEVMDWRARLQRLT